MALTKVKFLGTHINLTTNAIYNVTSEDSTNYFIVGDDLVLSPYPKTDFIPHWAVSSLAELVTEKAYTKDSYGTTYRIVSNDDYRLRLNSEEQLTTELVQLNFTEEYGGVARVINILNTSYGFSIAYTQDSAKVFTDLDDFVAYAQPLLWKVYILSSGEIIITDSNGVQLIPELLGLDISL